MKYCIGLDIGTTGAKALLVDEDGNVTGSATNEYPMSTPRPLWSEQNPEDWWTAARKSFRAVVEQSKIKAHDVAAIGLTGQMHGLVLLDAAGKVLRPCIMWNDQRTAAECAEITAIVGEARLLTLTANPVLPGFTAPKIVWVRKNEPEIFAKISHVLLPKDYIRYRLTGEFATDVSDASGTSLLDVKHRAWSSEMLHALHIPGSWMPRVVESIEVTGSVTPDASRETGLLSGTPVVGGAGDQAAGAVGNGIVMPGIVSVTVGTSGVVFAHTDQLAVEQHGRLHAFCHAVPGAWHVMGVTLAAGGSLRWFRDVLGEPERTIAGRKGVDPYEILMETAAQSPAGSEGLFFLPYLSGERTPHPDPNARGAFIGLTVRHTRAHLIRSVLEGVAYSLRDCLELTKDMGLKTTQIRASGGGARSPLWRQILSDVFDAELVTVTSTEGAPYGAALLAGVGATIYPTVADACRTTIHLSTSTQPDSVRSRTYNRAYGVYRELYPALKESFKSIADSAS